MKTDYKHDPYTSDEIEVIMTLIKEGNSAAKISELTGRSKGAINMLAYKVRKGQMANAPEKTVTPAQKPAVKVEPKIVKEELTPRDMIKKLYNMGYRIENNQLVCYVRQTVKVSDIVNG